MELPLSCRMGRRPMCSLGTHRSPKPHRLQPCYASNGVDVSTTAASSGQSHVVQAGETMSKIAEMYNISTAELKSINYGSRSIMKGDVVEVGKTLSLPAGVVKVAPRPAAAAPVWALPVGLGLVVMMAWKALTKKSEQEVETALVATVPATQSVQRQSNAVNELLIDAHQQIMRAESCLAEVVVMRSALKMLSADEQSTTWEAQGSTAAALLSTDTPVASTALLSNAVPLPSSIADKVTRPSLATASTSSELQAKSTGILEALNRALRLSSDGSTPDVNTKDTQPNEKLATPSGLEAAVQPEISPATPSQPAATATDAKPTALTDVQPVEASAEDEKVIGQAAKSPAPVRSPDALQQPIKSPAPARPRSPSPQPATPFSALGNLFTTTPPAPQPTSEAIEAPKKQDVTRIVPLPRLVPAPIVVASSPPTIESLFGSPRSPRSPTPDSKPTTPAPPTIGEAQSLDAIWATLGSAVENVVRALSPAPSRSRQDEAEPTNRGGTSPAAVRSRSPSPSPVREPTPEPAVQARAASPEPRHRSPSPPPDASEIDRIVQKVRALSPTPARAAVQPVAKAKTPSPAPAGSNDVIPPQAKTPQTVLKEEPSSIATPQGTGEAQSLDAIWSTLGAAVQNVAEKVGVVPPPAARPPTPGPVATPPAATVRPVSPPPVREAVVAAAPQAAVAPSPEPARPRSPSPASQVEQVVERLRALSPVPARAPESKVQTPMSSHMAARPRTPPPSRKQEPSQTEATTRASSPSPALQAVAAAQEGRTPRGSSVAPQEDKSFTSVVGSIAQKIRALSPVPARKEEAVPEAPKPPERSPSPSIVHMQADVVHLQANVVHMQQNTTEGDHQQSLMDIKASLLDLVYQTSRGLNTTPDQRAGVEELIGNLECRNPNNQASQSLSILDGRWKLVYTSSSETLLLLKTLDSLPLVDLGDVLQIIDTQAMVAHNKIDIKLPMQLSLRAESTFEMRSKRALRVRFTHVGLDTFIQTPQLLAALDLPESIQLWGGQIDLTPIRTLVVDPFNSLLASSKDMFTRAMSPELDIQCAELPSIWMVTTYLDNTLRITRDEAGRVFVMLKDVDLDA